MPPLFFFLLIITAANWSMETTISQEREMPMITIIRTNSSFTADTSRPRAADTIVDNREQEVEQLPIFITEEMPRFPGCEDLEGSYADKKNCADQKLLAYIYGNLNYPAPARLEGKEGIVVVSFTVTATGKIENVQVLRDIGAGTAEEAKRIVESMNELAPWIPARGINGKPVAVQYNLPIRYHLNY